jgi:immune inhibitor A
VADDRGTANPADDIKLDGYTMQYENVGTGVLVHEFGHDLGLPDLYDISGDGESSVVWWDLMSTGSHPGKLFDTLPTHMSAWSKFALGWADIQSVTPTLAKQNIILGQTSGPPAGSTQAVRVNLPPTTTINTQLLPGSTQAWWTNNDQNWADVRLTRDVNLVGKTAPISISFDLDGAAELDWDYMFLEVSVDGGATYTQTKGFEVGSNNELTTPDGYPDPNGRLGDYGNLVHGYTGDISELADNPVAVGTHGNWVHAYHNLSAYANKNIKLRFRYATDAAFTERGYFVDNIKIRAGSTTVLNDPVEGSNANGWTKTVSRFSLDEPLGNGWQFSNGIQILPLYYLLEWRNLHGFDRGLKYTYNTIFSTEPTTSTVGEWRVDKVPSNVPGMLVWLRDTRYGVEPFGANNTILGSQFFDLPSEGPKGGLLVIDSHPTPLRGPLGGTITTGQGTFPFAPANNWSGRVQTTNSAFGLQSTPVLTLTTSNDATTVFTPTNYAALPAVSLFDDAKGYYPGVEQLAVPVVSIPNRARIYAYSDPDASAVVPARGYYPPKTPAGFTGQTQGSDVSTFETILFPLGNTNVGDAGGTNVVGQYSGNPGDSGVQYGYHFQVISKAANGSTGTIQIWIGRPLYIPIARR